MNFFIAHERDHFGNHAVCIATSIGAFAADHDEILAADSVEEARDLARNIAAALRKRGMAVLLDDMTDGRVG